MRRIHLTVFGCQMNKLDAELAAETLNAAGHILVDDADDADTLLWVTCSVRDHAEQRALMHVEQAREAKRRRPGMVLGLLGCLAERRGADLFKQLPHLDLVCGTRAFPRLAEWLDRAEVGPVIALGDEADPDAVPWSRAGHKGVGAFVAVMRGCDNHCAYCVVPATRGGERYRDPDGVLAEVRAVVAAGAREVTLLGQNVDAYGRGTDCDLAALLRRIEQEIPAPEGPAGPGLARVRFVTSHPRDITPRLADAVAESSRVCPAFHMPAQSGSDAVLARMGRGYNRADYEAKLAMIRERVPGATVASDFIVGFPGETDADFAATETLVENSAFQNCFIFKYSPRPDTRAFADMPDDVPEAVKRERNRRLLDAQARSAASQAKTLVGARVEVLVEGLSPRDGGRFIGRTPGNRIAVFDRPPGAVADDWAGRLVALDIVDATPLTLHGRPVEV